MLVAWNDINRTFHHLDEMRRRFERGFTGWDDADAAFAAWAPGGPRLSVEESQTDYVVRALVPGMDHGSIEVAVKHDELTVSGVRRTDPPEGYRVLRRERRASRFTRTVALPPEIDVDNVKAVVRNGVLTVQLPKLPERQPRLIQVAAE